MKNNMKYYKEENAENFEFWSGARDTINIIESIDNEHATNYLQAFYEHLEEVFDGQDCSETDINDYAWFDSEYIFESIGLTADGELPNEKEEEDEN